MLGHLALAVPFIIHFASPPDTAPPAAVMVEYAPELEVSFIHPKLPPGVTQQRKVEAMTEQETAAAKEAPKLLIHDNAQIKLSASKPEPQRKKKIEVKKQSRRQQQEEKGNSTITSFAAPPTPAALTQRTTAPLDSDAARLSDNKISWESLVKGKINKMRHYPEDARRRKRTGTVIITFSVNERGEVLQSQLANSSGTHSLDRAALMALENARPLPPPPKELLRNGINKVTLPVEFGLLKI
ncbi:periplasmic colicin Js sensitivity protein CjrB [Klebsiella aerogenes]|nr:periplasmic colicin Js sensitivity protein CjrB [Klebsiella aerogenes]HDU6218655.1 energy transducer TonB [Klebsiella aerogenes]